MLNWFTYRLILMIPTLFLVMVVGFVLSKSVYSDPVEMMLTSQGVRLESSYGQEEYTLRYKEWGLHYPLFYVSVLPHFYPKNIHSYPDKNDKILIKNLLYERIHFDWTMDFLEVRSSVLKNKNQTDSYEDIIDHLHHSSSVTDLKKVQQICRAVKSPTEDIRRLIAVLNEMDNHKVQMYYPRLFWHGMQNQFHLWFIKTLSGDWGISIKDGRYVGAKITTALKWTAILTVISLILSLSISYITGLMMAYFSDSGIDKGLRYFWLVLYTMPVFWLASLLITYTTTDRYGSFLHLFPIPGRWYIPEGEPFMVSLGKYAYQLVLPVICLVANDISPMSQMIRNKLISQKYQSYVLLSRAKGLTPMESFRSHLLPHSWITLLTIAGGKVPSLLSGSLIIEVIFNIPGLGRLTYDSITGADWNVVFGILIFISSVVVVWMLLTDIAYKWADPRSEKYGV